MNSLFIAVNIVKRVLKSPMTVIAMILLPLILIFTILVAMKDVPASKPEAAIVDLDGGALGIKVAEYIGMNYEIVKVKEKNIADLVRDKKASFAVVIPKGFSEGIVEGREISIDFYMNGDDAGSASFSQSLNQYVSSLRDSYGAAEIIAGITGAERAEIAGKILKGVDIKQFAVKQELAADTESQAEGKAANPLIGFAVTFMMILIFTTIGIILDDKKKLTLARMFVSPVREWEIILGNLLGSLALGVIQLIPLVIALKISFGITSMYKLAGLFTILFCFLIAIIGIGIGISGLIKRAFNPATLIAAVIMPANILGGCFIPDSMLPDFINRMGYVVPQKWVLGAIQSILDGGSLGGVALNLAIILLFGMAFATFGLKTLRPLND